MGRGRRRSGPLAVCVAGLLVAGCAAGPSPAPLIGGVPVGEAETLVQRWEREWQAFPGLRAAVELRIARDGRTRRTAGVLLLSPTHLRFEAVAALGLPTLVLTAGPERILVFSPTENKAWAAPATADAMSRWLGFAVRPEMLIRLLRGRLPLPPGEGAVRVVSDGAPHIAIEHGPMRQMVWVSPGGEPARIRLENGERLTATFEWTVSGQLQSLGLEMPRRRVEVSLRFISAEYVAPPPQAFELVLPDGIPVEAVN